MIKPKKRFATSKLTTPKLEERLNLADFQQPLQPWATQIKTHFLKSCVYLSFLKAFVHFETGTPPRYTGLHVCVCVWKALTCAEKKTWPTKLRLR